MSMVLKVLIVLAGLGFVLAVFTVLAWPVFGITAESFSRASNNLALIAIALAVCSKQNSRDT